MADEDVAELDLLEQALNSILDEFDALQTTASAKPLPPLPPKATKTTTTTSTTATTTAQAQAPQQQQQQQWAAASGASTVRSKPIEIGLRGAAPTSTTSTTASATLISPPDTPSLSPPSTAWAGGSKPSSQRSAQLSVVGSAAVAAAVGSDAGLTVRVHYFPHLLSSSAGSCPAGAAIASTALPCMIAGEEPRVHELVFAQRDSASISAAAVLERVLAHFKSPRAGVPYGDLLVLQLPADVAAERVFARVLLPNDALLAGARDLGGGASVVDVRLRVSHCHVMVRDWRSRTAIATLPLLARADAALTAVLAVLNSAPAVARFDDAEDEHNSADAGADDAPTVDNACLFVPPLGEHVASLRSEAALAAMAVAPAIGGAVLPPPQYPDGRYVLPDELVLVAFEALLHVQHAQIAPFVGGAAHTVRVRRRGHYALLSVYEKRSEPAAPQYVDLYAPVRHALGALGASGLADDACVLLHARTRRVGVTPADVGVHLLPLDQPLAHSHARFGDELQRGLSLQKPWRVRVVYADGASDSVEVRATWSVEQLTQSALATSTARADRRRQQLIGAFLPPAKAPTQVDESSGAPLVPDLGTWGRWLAPSEAVLACRPLHDTSCLQLRQREWKVKVEIIAGSGLAATQATFVALDPFQTLASAVGAVLQRVGGGCSVEQHCVFVQYPVSGDRGGARVFGEWLSEAGEQQLAARLVYQVYNRCGARYVAEREREWCEALLRLQLHHRDVLEGAVAADDETAELRRGEAVSYLQSSRELGLVYVLARKIVLHVGLADNTSKAVPALATASVGELVQQTAKKLGLRNTTGFAFFCTERGVWLEPALSMPEQGVGLASAGGADDTNSGMNVVRVRMLRRYLLSDPTFAAQQSDAVALTLAYAQARGLVLSGTLALSTAVCVRLAALQMRVQFGEYVPRTHRAGFLAGKLLADFLPPPADRALELPIYSAFSNTSALSVSAAMVQYIAACRAPDVALSDELLQGFGLLYTTELKKRGGLARTKVFAELEPHAQRLTLRKGDTVHRALELDTVVRAARNTSAPRCVLLTFRRRAALPAVIATPAATAVAATTTPVPLSPPGSPLRESRGRSGTIDSRMQSLKRRLIGESAAVGDGGANDDEEAAGDDAGDSADESTLDFQFGSYVEAEQFLRAIHSCLARTLLPMSKSHGEASGNESLGAARPLQAHALYCGTPRTTVCDGLRVWVGTWNLGGAAPEADKLASWAPLDAADVYCVGTQEARYERSKEHGVDEWPVVLQRHFGGAFYVLASVTMWEIGLIVFARREHASRISGVSTATKATGIAGIAGNKGAVGAAFALHQTTVCVISSHLAARADHKRLMNRNENFAEIADDLAVSLRKKVGVDVLTQFDVVFWTGDLNYRIELPRHELLRLVAAEPHERHRMLRHDQLRAERAAQRAFATFAEPPLRFRPTYRMERFADAYCEQVKAKLTVQNAPSWCDRVLYHAQRDIALVALDYDAATALRTSDHRPVSALFYLEAPLAPHAFAAPARAFHILLYDVVARLRRPADVLRAASGAAPSAPPRQLQLRLVSRLLDDKAPASSRSAAAGAAAAPLTRVALALNAGSDPPRYQAPASCVGLGPFVALSGWCAAGEHIGLLVTEAKSDDAIAQCPLPLDARFLVGPPTPLALTLCCGGVPIGKLEMAIHVALDEK